MTEGYVGMMATVIPVIMLAGTVEAAAAHRKMQQSSQQLLDALRQGAGDPFIITTAGTAVGNTLKYLLGGTIWIGLNICSFAAEVVLILWLAGDERPESPGAAAFTAGVGILGFGVVALTSAIFGLTAFMRVLRENRALVREMRARQDDEQRRPA
jgi:hypothetical protein